MASYMGLGEGRELPKKGTTIAATTTESQPCEVHTDSGYGNAYSALGTPNVWPRGLPLGSLRSQHKHQWTRCPTGDVAATLDGKVVVLDSLTGMDTSPLYRQLPQTSREQEALPNSPSLVTAVPGVFMPYFSRASLHQRTAFCVSLRLPATVDAEAAAVWRGLIAQRIFGDAKWQVGFTLARWADVGDASTPEGESTTVEMEVRLQRMVAEVWPRLQTADILSESALDGFRLPGGLQGTAALNANLEVNRTHGDDHKVHAAARKLAALGSPCQSLRAVTLRLHTMGVLRWHDVVLTEAWAHDVEQIWRNREDERDHLV